MFVYASCSSNKYRVCAYVHTILMGEEFHEISQKVSMENSHNFNNFELCQYAHAIYRCVYMCVCVCVCVCVCAVHSLGEVGDISAWVFSNQ